MVIFGNTPQAIKAKSSDRTVMDSKAQNQGSDSFKSFLNSAVDNTSRYTSQKVSDGKQDKPVSQNFKSFRETKLVKVTNSSVSKTNTKADAKQVDNTSEIENDDVNNQNDNTNQVISVLSQMLGIKPEELKAIANELNFSEQDLKDPIKLVEFSTKLSDALGLSAQQTTVLTELTKQIANQLDLKPQVSVDSKEILTAPQQDECKQASADNKTELKISDISQQIKSKLEELIKEVKVEPQKLQSEVSKVIDIMRAQQQLRQAGKDTVKPDSTTGVQDVSLVEVNAENVQVSQTVSGNLADSNNLDSDAKADSGKDEDKSQRIMKSDSPKESEETAVPASNVSANQILGSNPEGDAQNVQPIVDLQTNQLNNQGHVSKTSNAIAQPVKTADVINQVIEQAKVTLGHDKSEMVIDLKPDHLGKLSLKVVTEQGIVAAKFMAENQQVKEILESNMQLLKDSLQKQGISIEGVSVQVGNQSKNSFQQEAFENKKSSSSNRVSYQDGNRSSVAGITTVDVLPEKLAQYSYETSTLNLTA